MQSCNILQLPAFTPPAPPPADELIGGVIVTLQRAFQAGLDDVRAPLRTKEGKDAGELQLILKWTPDGGGAAAYAPQHAAPPQQQQQQYPPPAVAAAGGYPPPVVAAQQPAATGGNYPPPAVAAQQVT